MAKHDKNVSNEPSADNSAKDTNAVDRRKFLKSAAVGGMATLVAGATGGAAAAAQPAAPASRSATAIPLPAEGDPTGAVKVLTNDRPGSDFMVDVIKSLGFEFVAANPGSSFRGLHESIINYGQNKAPEFITCTHEEISVALAQGYAEVEGKPLLALAHSTVGLQHASMALYNSYAGRVPVFLILGNTLDLNQRRPGAEWNHSAQDPVAMVRDYTKWDDTPQSLTHFAESTVRAYKLSMTYPRMPVIIVADSDLQETPVGGQSLRIPKLNPMGNPQGDSGSVAEVARLLVNAQNPVIVAGRVVHSQDGMSQLAAFAEALQVPVIDRGANLPSHHPLNQTNRAKALVQAADVIVGMNVQDYWNELNSYQDQVERNWHPVTKNGVKLIHITTDDFYLKSNYQNFQRFMPMDLAVGADPETTLPSLTEAVKRLTTDDRKRAFQDRGAKLADARQKSMERAREEATFSWNISPISPLRTSIELWNAVKNEDWALVGDKDHYTGESFIWNVEKYYQRRHDGSATGIGFGAPSAVGAALAHRKYGRLCVYQQNDGDLMYAPGSLWTAAHHKIPMLAIMNNNRCYNTELMHLQRMADRHQRGIDRTNIGVTLVEPNIDYAKLAESMGVHGIGPISDPKDLGPAIRRGVDMVKNGEPALIDVVAQPR